MAIIYCRVSPKPKRAAAVTLDSIEVQQDTCRRYCKTAGIENPQEITDRSVSARTSKLAERPGGKRLLEAIENGERHVIVAKLDRIFRNLGDGYETLERWRKTGVTLHIASQGQTINVDYPEGWLTCIMSLVFAEYEPRVTSHRLSTAARIKSDHGYYIGGWLPNGATVDGNGKLQHAYDVGEFERRVQALDAMGLSGRQIVKELKTAGIEATRWQVRQTLARLEQA